MSDIMEIVQVRSEEQEGYIIILLGSEGTFGGYVLLGAEKNYEKQT